MLEACAANPPSIQMPGLPDCQKTAKGTRCVFAPTYLQPKILRQVIIPPAKNHGRPWGSDTSQWSGIITRTHAPSCCISRARLSLLSSVRYVFASCSRRCISPPHLSPVNQSIALSHAASNKILQLSRRRCPQTDKLDFGGS